MVQPVDFIARKNNQIYRAKVERFVNSKRFGCVSSNIPEQPETMRDLVELRYKGYIIEDVKEGVYANIH